MVGVIGRSGSVAHGRVFPPITPDLYSTLNEPSSLTPDQRQVNRNFVYTFARVAQETRNMHNFHKAICTLNGQIVLVRFGTNNDGNPIFSAAIPRTRDWFHPLMLQRAIEAIVVAAAFSDPVFRGCNEDEAFDVAPAICRREEELRLRH